MTDVQKKATKFLSKIGTRLSEQDLDENAALEMYKSIVHSLDKTATIRKYIESNLETCFEIFTDAVENATSGDAEEISKVSKKPATSYQFPLHQVQARLAPVGEIGDVAGKFSQDISDSHAIRALLSHTESADKVALHSLMDHEDDEKVPSSRRLRSCLARSIVVNLSLRRDLPLTPELACMWSYTIISAPEYPSSQRILASLSEESFLAYAMGYSAMWGLRHLPTESLHHCVAMKYLADGFYRQENSLKQASPQNDTDRGRLCLCYLLGFTWLKTWATASRMREANAGADSNDSSLAICKDLQSKVLYSISALTTTTAMKLKETTTNSQNSLCKSVVERTLAVYEALLEPLFAINFCDDKDSLDQLKQSLREALKRAGKVRVHSSLAEWFTSNELAWKAAVEILQDSLIESTESKDDDDDDDDDDDGEDTGDESGTDDDVDEEGGDGGFDFVIDVKGENSVLDTLGLSPDGDDVGGDGDGDGDDDDDDENEIENEAAYELVPIPRITRSRASSVVSVESDTAIGSTARGKRARASSVTSESSQNEHRGVAKRAPGRAKKVPSVDTAAASREMSPKRVRSPRKCNSCGEEEHAASPKKASLRKTSPKKASPQKERLPINSPVPSSRKRGRPPKSASKDEDNGDEDNLGSEGDAEAPVIKRGRGRPKKSTSKDEGDGDRDDVESDTPVVKRGRGRPRKNSDLSDVLPAPEAGASPAPTPAKRGRGRPPKSPTVLEKKSPKGPVKREMRSRAPFNSPLPEKTGRGRPKKNS
jgi:hypothetical protein